MKTTNLTATETSSYTSRGSETDRRAVLLRGSREDLARLVAAKAAGWTVTDEEMSKAQAYVRAFGG